MRKLRHHDDDSVLLSRGDEPVFNPRGEIVVVERLPGFVDDDDRWFLVLDLSVVRTFGADWGVD